MESDSSPLSRLLTLTKPHPRETYHGEPWPVPVAHADLLWALEEITRLQELLGESQQRQKDSDEWFSLLGGS